MRGILSKRAALFSAVVALLLCILPPANAYSVLTHEEIVDMAWLPHMVPLLRARYPGITDDQLREAHAYAYGGSVVQDLGYYPRGSKLFSDLTHYVNTGEFVNALLTDATNADELAFALGALAHYTSDETGHPYVNRVTAQNFPKLRARYGDVVTYEEDKTAHLRTEFGFDVVGVARGHYAQQDYRSFIGFEVPKPLLERAFQQTYGLPLSSVIRDEDRSINAARWAVRDLIPHMTQVALLTYSGDIEHANPGFDRRKFVYRMRRTEFEKSWGNKGHQLGIGSHILAFFIKILPKVGPLKALKLVLPNGDQQTLYLRSVNESVDLLDTRIDQMARIDQVAKTAPDAQAPAPVQLQSIDLDTGKRIAPGEYGLSDKAHAELLDKLVKSPGTQVPPELRGHLDAYFSPQNDSANRLHSNQRKWRKVESDLRALQATAPAVHVAASGN